MVPRVGLEPTRLSPGDFKSPVYYQFHHQGINFNYLVPPVGLEPTLLSEADFESAASTNSAREAYIFGALSEI